MVIERSWPGERRPLLGARPCIVSSMACCRLRTDAPAWLQAGSGLVGVLLVGREADAPGVVAAIVMRTS